MNTSKQSIITVTLLPKYFFKFQRHASMQTVTFGPINERFGPVVQSMKHTVENCGGKSC